MAPRYDVAPLGGAAALPSAAGYDVTPPQGSGSEDDEEEVGGTAFDEEDDEGKKEQATSGAGAAVESALPTLERCVSFSRGRIDQEFPFSQW